MPRCDRFAGGSVCPEPPRRVAIDVRLARGLARDGSHVIDLCVDYVGRDGSGDMAELAGRMATSSTLPIMLDSTEPEVIRAGLETLGGRCAVNSVNYEDGDGPNSRFTRIMQLVVEHGAALASVARSADTAASLAGALTAAAAGAVVVLAMDLDQHRRHLAQQRRRGRAAPGGNAAQGIGHEAVGAAAALEQELVVPAGRQAQLELGAVVTTISAGAGFDLAAHHAMLLGLQRLARGAGEGRVGVLRQTAALHPLHALDDHVGQFHFLQVAAAALGVSGIVRWLGSGGLGVGGPEQAAGGKTAGKQRQQGGKAVQFHGMGSGKGPERQHRGGSHPAGAFRPHLPRGMSETANHFNELACREPGREKAAREMRPVRASGRPLVGFSRPCRPARPRSGLPGRCPRP